MIIDFHTHIFPDKIAPKAIAVLQEGLKKVSHYENIPKTDATLSGLKKSMSENHIDYSVVMPIATTVSQSDSINSFALSVTGTDGVISFGSVHPMQENALEVLENISRDGLIGIKLHPEFQNFYIDSEESMRVLKKAEELGLYVMLHSGVDDGIFPPVHCTPERLKNALKKLSGENIIAAHMGAYRMWDGVLEYLCGTPIYFDTSYSVGRMNDEQAKEIIRKHGTKKILFGSDSPWQCQGKTVIAVKNLHLGDEAEYDIFYRNGAKICKLI